MAMPVSSLFQFQRSMRYLTIGTVINFYVWRLMFQDAYTTMDVGTGNIGCADADMQLSRTFRARPTDRGGHGCVSGDV